MPDPKKKNEYIRVLMDLDPDKKDEIVLQLLCNVLLQVRENQDSILYLYRALGTEVSGFRKQEIENWHEQESTKLSAFLSRWAKSVDYQRRTDEDDKAKKP